MKSFVPGTIDVAPDIGKEQLPLSFGAMIGAENAIA